VTAPEASQRAGPGGAPGAVGTAPGPAGGHRHRARTAARPRTGARADAPRLLVGVDGSAESAQAVRWAAMIARWWGARITLLHAAVPTPTRSSLDTSPAAARRAEEAARRRGEEVLRKAAALVRPPTRVEQELVFGQPAEAILRRIRELEAQLVVVGNKGKGTIESLLLGSTSAAVMRQAGCSVLVVRRGQVRWPVGDAVAQDPTPVPQDPPRGAAPADGAREDGRGAGRPRRTGG
jgi:nucleotide-binding universal stress UspA family protein